MENENEIRRKIEIFFERKIPVHVCLNSNRFYNGLIMELGSDFLVLNDRCDGDMFIVFSEIDWIDKYTDIKRGEGYEE
jgi:hypothetical protein